MKTYGYYVVYANEIKVNKYGIKLSDLESTVLTMSMIDESDILESFIESGKYLFCEISEVMANSEEDLEQYEFEYLTTTIYYNKQIFNGAHIAEEFDF